MRNARDAMKIGDDRQATVVKQGLSSDSSQVAMYIRHCCAEMMALTVEAQKTCSVILTPDSCNLPICRGRCFRMLRGFGACIPYDEIVFQCICVYSC
ncbi:hypothetical protein IEQ34_000696 [Dendrobium chrysotoxum]|uniref:Uncharacterized protein n=1 Tax=Dendrobium chrysotoxum TaxID=161865 RepID=A0AAV7HTW7_DENCH|nr:hypothetical protein IEQ34_000696 [Dendrobium chrysotoxum]